MVDPERLRVVQEFRGEVLEKGRATRTADPTVARADRRRGLPKSEQIRAPWPDKPTIFVERTTPNSECYLCDGSNAHSTPATTKRLKYVLGAIRRNAQDPHVKLTMGYEARRLPGRQADSPPARTAPPGAMGTNAGLTATADIEPAMPSGLRGVASVRGR